MKSKIKKHWWPVVFCFAIASVVYLGAADAKMNGTGNWKQVQSRDLAIAGLDSPLRYLCVNGTVFDLGSGGPVNPLEHSLVLDHDASRDKCILPFIPVFQSTGPSLVATSPESGYGAALYTLDGTPAPAVQNASSRLSEVGWRSNGLKPGAKPRLPGEMFVRGGAWIFVQATSFDPKTQKTKLLVAGNFQAATSR